MAGKSFFCKRHRPSARIWSPTFQFRSNAPRSVWQTVATTINRGKGDGTKRAVERERTLSESRRA